MSRDDALLVEAKDLRAVVGLSRPRVYALMKDGAFPLPRRISPGRIAWLRSDLESWASARPVSVEPVRRITARKKPEKKAGRSTPDQPADATGRGRLEGDVGRPAVLGER